MQPAAAIVLVMLGCCSNVVFLEFLTKAHPGCGNLVTFSQFLFISVHGFLFTMRCGRESSKIPIREYVIMVGMFFASSVLNNYALNFGIPMPLHMIFKSGSLVANLLMGMVVLKRFYRKHKYIAVVLITLGIILCTLASQAVKNAKKADAAATVEQPAGLDRSSPVTLAVGAGVLTAALLLSARLGIFQEVLYKTHGKHAQQALFITHSLPLPGFLLLMPDIIHHARLFSESEAVLVGTLELPVPRLWLCLLCNVITQYVCISSVFRLTEQCTSLTVTLVVTLRKFVSLLFSIWYFANPFVAQHWVGSALVFAGTLLFTDPCGAFAPSGLIVEK
ncbi:UDP-xylose and UDP-N-acetylglucosamine transporter-like [Pollicipes pollicipes]|uniref:UDP-xylose and UDP-N-acetylglucosamine transporter-like n=1 Tax=Pollicipes pollicipes TaxID=41117 RepID=UPI001884A1B9|nr:UDP-xylose and UDP-N-acetylglucosamine transporter-like [Pollicipes pollicipes]XP_037070793.1 UDP-xylose and UDP-N-acetylglucosamine transporter-like [Pollicipes pollicipes]XP_037070794.1 UDP-xylose and UDP-N-acetylglucosamine transporter-like [Pollicipes pollicipes]XP_037070795.1 UDP-xylose and UDP-N-acetylglucosamine transporter-like [Pollicipes pollicipes]XP_037070797.1 UDP-xylose and UDP-N-acetylglucosamine transporter-like [Pollicipes pollicipes]